MNPKAKKVIKIVAWTVGIIILIPVLLLATLPLWLGPIARPTVNALGPKVTRTEFNIDRLYLNPYTCNFELGGVRIANPEGFTDPDAIKLGYFNVDVETASLASDVIVVENVEVSDLYITLLKNDEGKTNLDVIKANMTKAEEQYEQEVAAEEQKIEAEQREEGVPEAEIKQARESRQINKKLIVNRFVFKNVSGKFAVTKSIVVPFRIPSIELKDIGRDSGGYDLDHLGAAVAKEFWASVMAQASDIGGVLGGGAGKAVDSLKDAGKSAGESLKNAGDSLKNAGKSASESLKNAGDSLKSLFR